MPFEFFGKETFMGFLQMIYDTILNDIRSKVETGYAPPLETYSNNQGVVTMHFGGITIPKYEADYGLKINDAFYVANFEEIDRNATIQFELQLYIVTKPHTSEDVSKIFKFGTENFSRMFKNSLDSLFYNSLINDVFLITIDKIEFLYNVFGDLNINLSITAINEKEIAPGGREYEEIKYKTKVGRTESMKV